LESTHIFVGHFVHTRFSLSGVFVLVLYQPSEVTVGFMYIQNLAFGGGLPIVLICIFPLCILSYCDRARLTELPAAGTK